MAAASGLTVDRRTWVLVGACVATSIGVAWVLVQSVDASTVELFGAWNGPLWVTLRVAALAVVLASSGGVLIGYALAKARFPGRDLVEAMLSLPMILPPTVVGYYAVVTLGSDKPLGRLAVQVFGVSPVHSLVGCVIVAAVAAFPFTLRATRNAVERVDRRAEDMGRAMGLPQWRVALRITIPLAWRGILVGITLGTLRALGEYGATLMIGGAIPNQTRTMSIAVANALTPQERSANLAIALVLAVLALGGLAYLRRSAE